MIIKKPRNNHSQSNNNLLTAVKKIKDGELSIYSAVKTFKIPKTTLRRHLENEKPTYPGRQQIISEESEKELADWVIEHAERGDPLLKTDVLQAATQFDMLQNNPPRFGKDGPSKKWFNNFMSRNPKITFRKPEPLGKAAAVVCEEDVDRFFYYFRNWLEKNDLLHLLNRPEAFMNLDETGFDLNAAPNKVLAKRGAKTVYTVHSAKVHDRITVTFCFNAAGETLRPQIIFKKNFSGLLQVAYASGQAGTDFLFCKSEDGWQTQSTFFEYVKKLDQDLTNKNIERPVIIFYDGHKSHINYELFKWCKERQIIVVIFFPNCTHILQMCDVAIFGPTKQGWKTEVNKYKTENKLTELMHDDFIRILSTVMKRVMTPEIIKNGFRATGVFPLDPGNIHRDRFLGTKCNLPSNIQTLIINKNINDDDVSSHIGNGNFNVDNMEIDIDALDIVYEEEISASLNQPTTSDLNILSSASEQYQTQHLIEPFSCHYYNEVSSVQSPPHIQSSQFNFKEFISYLNVLNEPALKILKEENHPAWINVQIIQQQIDLMKSFLNTNTSDASAPSISFLRPPIKFQRKGLSKRKRVDYGVMTSTEIIEMHDEEEKKKQEAENEKEERKKQREQAKFVKETLLNMKKEKAEERKKESARKAEEKKKLAAEKVQKKKLGKENKKK